MSESLFITGGEKLNGAIRISGAKNAALPLLAASLMTEQPVQLGNMPDLADTRLMVKLLCHMGKQADIHADNWTLSGETTHLDAP